MRFLMTLAILVFCHSASATTAVRTTLTQLVSDSEIVVLGTVGTAASYWQAGRILTRVPVLVDEVWLGDGQPDTVVEVVTLGGRVGEIGQRVSGALRMSRGERVVLCLHRRQGVFLPVHMGQGAFFVDKETSSDPPVRRRSFGAKLVGPPTAAMPVTLRALEEAIREAAHARR